MDAIIVQHSADSSDDEPLIHGSNLRLEALGSHQARTHATPENK